MLSLPSLNDIQTVVSQYLQPASQTQQSDDVAGQTASDNSSETDTYIEVDLEDVDIPEILDNTAKKMNDIFGKINNVLTSLLDSLKGFFSGSHSSSDDALFSDEDIETVMDIVDNIPGALQGFVDLDEDQIRGMAEEIEEVGLENYIRQYGDQYANMLPEGFIDDLIDNLKDGDTDEVYKSLMKLIDEQVKLPIVKASSFIGGDLKKSILAAIEMLSEKI